MHAGELDIEMNENKVLLQVDDVKKYFPIHKGLLKRTIGEVKAVDGISFSVNRGQTFGLVGESGCGKTTLGRCILQVLPLTSGTISFDSQRLSYVGKTRPKDLSSKMQVVFQDPASSLNPRHKIKDIILEPLVIQGRVSKKEMYDCLDRLYEMVGLEADMGERYPHMLSGGQQQRVSIARAMIAEPSFIVCDEPVASLDVSIRAQIINLLKNIQKKLGLSYLFISHDLSVVHYISDVVAVMYLGKIVEISPKTELYANPGHPYTQVLLSAVPVPDPLLEKKRNKVDIKGEVPSAVLIPSGCSFHPRCDVVRECCSEEVPALQEVSPGHWVACHATDAI